MPGSQADVRGRSERSRVAELQAGRMLDAAIQVCAERGAASIAVADIVERAGVSRRTFYEVFADTSDCLLAALELAAERAQDAVVVACEDEPDWRARIRCGLVALLALFDEERDLAQMLVVEWLAAGHTALERRTQVLQRLTRAVQEGARASGAEAVSPLMAEGVVGGMLSVVHARLVATPDSPLLDLAGSLASMVVLPYLGPQAAREELGRSAAPVAKPAPRAAALRFGEIGIRLTYRTVRVLQAIGEQPGGSNRQIGQSADIEDQGQISKLLARLQRRGMIENVGAGRAHGGANAWRLTPLGEDVNAMLARSQRAKRS